MIGITLKTLPGSNTRQLSKQNTYQTHFLSRCYSSAFATSYCHLHPTLLSFNMLECPTCDEEFYDAYDRNDHVSDYDHWIECETCPKRFASGKARMQHMQALDHYRKPEYECETCDQAFWNQHAVNQHMKAKGHWRNYCQSCDRHFQNESNHRAVCESILHLSNLCWANHLCSI